MPELLCVPLKVVGEVDLVKPLGGLLKTKKYPDSVTASLQVLQGLRARMVAVIRTKEVTESGLEAMHSYYDQLGNLETKIPFAQAKIYFKWLDAFDKGGWLGEDFAAYTMSTSLVYEKACVLFNIAALSTQLAGAQEQEQEEGLKRATQLLQSAAGVFSAMTIPLPATSTEQKPTKDLSPACLEALASLCLAQAQDCVLQKALRDQKKPVVVAKLASHAKKLYLETGLALGVEEVKGMWESHWVGRVEGRGRECRGLVELQQSLVCKEAGRHGERIARLQEAVKHLAGSKDLLAEAEAGLKEAVKDNEFIYHERVPAVDSLDPVVGAAVVKATPLSGRWREGGEDIFREMPPWGEVKIKKEECVVS